MASLTRRSVGILALLSTAAFAGAWNFTFLAPVLPDVAGDTGASVYGVVAASGALAGAATGGLALAIEGYVTMASVFTLMALSAASLLLMPVSDAPLPRRRRLAAD